MQDRRIPFEIKAISSRLGRAIKWGMLLFVLLFIGFKLYRHPHLGPAFWANLQFFFTSNSSFFIIIPLVLMPLNWGLEARKWQLLAEKLIPLSFFQATRGVLSGLALSFVTPHGIGDYLGRIWQLPSHDRFTLVGGILIGRWAQFGATVLGGLIAILLVFHHRMQVSTTLLLGVLAAMPLLAVGAVWGLRLLIPRFSSIAYLFQGVFQYPRKRLAQVAVLSVARYLVFSLQFFLILWGFQTGLSAEILAAGVAWVFFVKSVVPSFNFLSDLGVREVSALLYFEAYEVDPITILTASLMVWGVNLLLPTLMGVAFLPQFKWKTL
jgi:hypothetical protein